MATRTFVANAVAACLPQTPTEHEHMECCLGHAVPKILALALASSSAMASPPTVIWCNACTDEQKQAAAVESNAGSLVYVADVVAHSAVPFDVDSTQGTRNDWRIAGAPAHVGLTSEQRQAIQTLSDFYETLPQGWRKSGVLHYTEASVNASGAARDGPEQRALIDWVSRQPDVVPVDLLRRVARSLPAVRIHPSSAAPSVKYRIDFSDGSGINMAFALSAAPPAYVIEADPAQDSRNSPLLVETSPLPAWFDIDRQDSSTDSPQ